MLLLEKLGELIDLLAQASFMIAAGLHAQ
jgi:hypothetical protein